MAWRCPVRWCRWCSWAHAYYQKALAMVTETQAQRARGRRSKTWRMRTGSWRGCANTQPVLRRLAEEAERTKAAFVAKFSPRVPHAVEHDHRPGQGNASRTHDLSAIPSPPHSSKISGSFTATAITWPAWSTMCWLSASRSPGAGVTASRSTSRRSSTGRWTSSGRCQREEAGAERRLPHHLSPISCDRTRIRQVILNLLSNAARFTDKGGISVTPAKR